MKILKGVGEFFALDIGTNAVRVVQLSSGTNDTYKLAHYGHVSIEEKLSASSSEEGRRRLGEAIMTAVGQSGIRTKDVVVGLPSSKTFTTVIDVASMPEAELKSTMRYQIDQFIPMPLDEAKVDWVSLGQSLHDQTKLEVLLTSVAIEYAEERLEFVESLGLNVVGLEPDPIALTRSLLPKDAKDARLIIDVGDQSTDLVITYGDSPRLVRSIPLGLRTLVKATTQNLNVKDDQASQFILKFGLAPDKLEGQVYRALEMTLENFAGEITKSIKFFQTRYANTPVTGILLSGYAAVIPMFGEYVASKTSVQAALANPWQHVQLTSDQQQQLAPVASEFASATGLAQRRNNR